MIVLSNYSISWSKNNNQDSFTGVVDSTTNVQDSVFIAFSDLKVANSKMIELDYVKQINIKLNENIKLDSIYNRTILRELEQRKVENTDLRRDRHNIGILAGIELLIIILLSL